MSNIVSFSNMSVEEFISLNVNNIPPEIIKILNEKLSYIKQLEDENRQLKNYKLLRDRYML